MPRRRVLAFHAAMWTVALAGCLAVVVGYLGWKGARLPRVPVRYSGDWLIEGDPEIGFVPVRNGATEMHHLDSGLRYHIFTDARRARVDAPGVQTPAHVDVVAVGCSFTWGHGVESEQTYAQQLGRLLGVPVANLGMGSYGTVQSWQTLRRNADLAPKVVVYGFIQDHLRRNVWPCAPNYVPYCMPVSYLRREGSQLVLHPPHMELFTPEENRAFLTEIALQDPGGPGAWVRGAKWAARMEWFRWSHADVVDVDTSPPVVAAAIDAMIGSLVEATRAVGARLVVLNMPYLPRGRVQPVPPELARAIAGKDLTFVDFGPVASDFYARNPTGTLTLDPDPHPSAAAHRMIAETLAPVVRALLDGAAPAS